MGVSLWSYKLQAFFIGCVYAGVAGHCWFTTMLRQCRPVSLHGFSVVSGHVDRRGMGSTSGAIMGAFLSTAG